MADAGFTSLDSLNFLAGKAVASATAFLGGRSSSARLATEADQLLLDMLAIPTHPPHPAAFNLSDPARLLIITLMRIARCSDEWRLARWEMIAGALVELVRRESNALRDSGGLSA